MSVNETPTVATFPDHEVITPANKLRKALTAEPLPPGEDPVERAERALKALSSEFAAWMESECDRLDRARKQLQETGFTPATKQELFHAAHDIKGEAATFGYPAVAYAAESLCRLLEHTPDVNQIPAQLIDQHVSAVRAIFREYNHSDAKELSSALGHRLREVTEEFLKHENRDRPDYLESIDGPTLAPDQST